ncbi:hypothetical protein F8388_003698 [Cannabis sativa]|uniref:NAC domain-containing protein n=1 Tax=Cannabis sativa TaxID=3483 RepID=A0A7J6F9M3_CANSA|nr:hypothetical protein F8388_003698 [Cannabis sativa]
MSKYHRFNPTDTELIAHLKLKIDGERSKLDDYIAEIDVCNWEPWELPGMYIHTYTYRYSVLFFFSFLFFFFLGIMFTIVYDSCSGF